MLTESERKLQDFLQAEYHFGQGHAVTVNLSHRKWPSDNAFIKYCVSVESD